jgi:hypothetical protein
MDLTRNRRKNRQDSDKGEDHQTRSFYVTSYLEQSVKWQAPLYLNFIDFEKVFDSIHRES